MKPTPLLVQLFWMVALIPGLLSAQVEKSLSPGGQKDPTEKVTEDVTQGALRVVQDDGNVVECPLQHTDVEAEISGFIARVKVTQTFFNPFQEKIEAVYVFPLPHQSAVDDMTMVIGDRRIVGVIKRRAEARRIYEQALLAGQSAALLEQERPNIFTQSVGNIKPKQEVKIEITYVDVLEYDQGDYEFHFPMVVGPRYIPGGPVSGKAPIPPELSGKVAEVNTPEGTRLPQGTGWSPDTKDVPDASRITPPVLKPGFRTGHDISLAVNLDAGVPIQGLKSINHQAGIQREGTSRAQVNLLKGDSVPNKDFILRYGVMGEKPEMAVLCHTDGQTGYFLLMLQPKADEQLAKTPPREIVFLVDVSGSMSGNPIAKSREAMEKFLGLLREKDTVQVITFQSRAEKLFERPVPATPGNIRTALNFSQRMKGGGGTEMLKGVLMAINEPIDKERMRIVIMLTDGYIGNEAQIIEAVGKGCGDQIRFWCMGIGKSVNRFLVDGVARQGGGMGKVVSLNEDAGPTVEEFMTRIQRAQLSKIKIHWAGMETSEIYPARIPELWAGRPVILQGLYRLSSGGKTHRIQVSGLVEGEPVSWPLEVALPVKAEKNLALSKVWARKKIEDLMQQTYYSGSPEVEEEVTAIALEYRLMSQYTSFVAVDESEVPQLTREARPPRRMLVPVPMPEGVSYEGVFGRDRYESADGRWGFGTRSLNELRKAPSVPTPVIRSLGRYSAPSPAPTGGIARGYRLAADGLDVKRRGAIWASSASRPSSGPASTRSRTRRLDMASGGRSAQPLREAVLRAGFAKKEESLLSFTPYLQLQILAPHYQEIQNRIPGIIQAAKELKKGEKLLESREEFARAYLLDAALTNASMSDGSRGDQILSEIEEINQEIRKAWKKELPALEKKLDLILRNQDIPEAVREVARAAGIDKIQELPGSLEDSAELLGRKDVRVTHLDLRNATVSQALDWILLPARLSWQVVNGEGGPAVQWGSSRRILNLKSAWVYNVGHLSDPLPEELEGETDRQKQIEILRKAQMDLLGAIQKALGVPVENLAWYGPGELLIFSESKTHIEAARIFKLLVDPGAEVEDDLKAIHKLTSARAEKRKDLLAKLPAEREKADVLFKIYENTWPLLSQAAGGASDDEALTELEIAWKTPQVAEIVKGPGSLTALRSAWAVSEAARTLVGVSRLQDLSSHALRIARPAADEALAILEKNPEDWGAWLSVFYASLSYRNEGEFLGKAKKTLFETSSEKSNLAVARALGKAILNPDVDPVSLAQAFQERNSANPRMEFASGDDLVFLTALACRRAGGEPWRAFRADAKQILGEQPLSGSLVVLVNRLSKTDLALLKETR